MAKLMDICTKIGSGATPRGGSNTYIRHGISLIRSQNILDLNFTKVGLVYINKEQAEKLNNVEVQSEDVLINITGDSVARVCKMNPEYLPARVNQHVAIIRVDKTKSNSNYILYFLQNSKNYLLQLASAGATRNALTKGMLEQLELDLPPLETQQKIASILSALDDKIALNRKINENLEAQLTLQYHKIFDNLNRDTLLGSVLSTTSGGTPSRKNTEYYKNANICWVKSKELGNGYISVTDEHINTLAINNSAAKILPENSVLIAMYGATVGAYGIIATPMACNQAICALLHNDNYPYTYLYQFISTIRDEIINLAIGSAQQNISQVIIKNLLLHSDLLAIQKFHNFATPIHGIIKNINIQNRRLAALRDTLLPRLMSGKIDVTNIDI